MRHSKSIDHGPLAALRKHLLQFFVLLYTVFLTVHLSAASPVVLFDQGHNQQFMAEKRGPLDLSLFAGLFVEQGAQVKTTTSYLSKSELAGVDILIISGAFSPISADEGEIIIDFLRSGGKVVMLTHIPSPFKNILQQLGVSVSTGVVQEQDNIIGSNPQDFQVRDLSPHPLTSGIDNFSIYGGWALLARNENVTSVARTSSKAWVDLNRNGVLNEQDAMMSFSMVLSGRLGQGYFVVFGDDAIFQNQFLKDENLTLAKNLVSWLCGSGKAI